MMTTKSGRTSEQEYSIAVLRYLAKLPSGEASVTTIKREMPKLLNLTPGDLAPSGTRSEEMYKQIVGNIVSHRKTSSENFVNRGLLSHRPRYLSITDAGRRFLSKLDG